MDESLHSGQQNSFGGSGVDGICGVGAGPAASAGAIATTRILEDLEESVASLSEEYCSAKQELRLKLSIRFRPHWERTFRKVSDSVAALDKKRADAQKLLCEG
jgi:hypothetical protein